MIYYILSAAMINRRVRTTIETMTIWSASLLAVDGVAELAGNVTSKLGENATSTAIWMGRSAAAVEGNPHMGPHMGSDKRNNAIKGALCRRSSA